ncbi:MAG: choice-of-anchor J domain-containing protein [Muribaculaceae bacterium]|nr:choice-of-anchor J domain-containing protein [Muribaculaceae bacterium]
MKKILLLTAAAGALLVSQAALPERMLKPAGAVKELTKREAVRPAAAAPVTYYDAEAVITVPFTHSLGKNEAITTQYVVFDANEDEKTWKPGGFSTYSVCMVSTSKTATEADDWMISPAISLEGGKYYTVKFEYDMTLSKTEEKLALYAGTEQTVEGMTLTVVPEFAYEYNDKVFRTKEAQFKAPETGDYYFGFHCTSEVSKSGNPKICNFSMEECENPLVAPDYFLEVPASMTMCKNSDNADNYTVIDANEDGKGWKPLGLTTGSTATKGTGETQDDWLITPAIHLMPGVNYEVKFKEGMSLSTAGKEDILALYAGTAPTVEGMTITVMAPHTYTVNAMTPVETLLTVNKEGYYYFGFHTTSVNAKSGYAKVSDFSVKESTEKVVPPAAGTLEFIPADKGELKATVKYTAPTLDKEGNPLTQLTQAIVTVNWAFKTTLTDIVPGGEYTIETTDVYNNAYNRVEAVAYIGEEAGESALLTDLFCGMDTPLPPTNVKATLSEDYNTVTLTWDAIGTVGEKGGYVDNSDVTYYVFDAFGSYYDPALTETKELTATFDFTGFEGQDFAAYQVTAGVGENYSLDEVSNIVIVGQPEKLPYYESFADGNYNQAWAVDLESTGQVMNGIMYDNELQTNTDADEGVEPEYLNSHDGDNGFFFLMPIDINSAYGLFSTKISLEGAENPVFEFWYQGKGSVLDAKVAVDGGDFEVVKSIDLKEESTDDWTLCRIDLSAYKSAHYIQIGFLMRAIHNTDENIWSVPVDNIRVIDLKDEAMRVSVASIAETVKAGEEIPVMMTVENIGRNPLTEAHMHVIVDGEDLDPAMFGALQPGEVASAKVSVPTSVLSADKIAVKAHAKSSADNIHHTALQDVEVKFPRLPMPEDVKATATTINAELKWTAPELAELTAPKEIAESFESEDAEPFDYKGYGDWQFVDLDGAKNYTFLGDKNNPYRTQPMAYQLFTPEISGMEPEDIEDFCAHSGKTMLVAWSCQSQNANLLISPELSGEAQTISFWGRGFTIAQGLNETLSVWYSTTDTEVASFTEVKEIEGMPESGIVPEEWTEFKFEIPEGAKYFAVLHDAYDSYCLFLDDFSFKAAGELPADTELTGYNLYVNGEKAQETAETETVHTPEAAGTYAYRLSAQYNNGESRATEPQELEFTESVGLAEIADGVKISRDGNTISVTAPAATPIAIVDLQGHVLAKGNGNLTVTLPVGTRIVIVSAGSNSAKITLN